MYASEHRNLVPILHDGTGYGGTGKIVRSGGRFADKYMEQSVKKPIGAYADLLAADNVFQCPSALQNSDQFAKDEGTNYRISGFGLYTGGNKGLHPNTMVIGGTVQSKVGKIHPAGEVAMAMDWIWDLNGAGLSGGYGDGKSLYNHRNGANVLYGSGAAKWVPYSSMIRVSSRTGMVVPPGTYGFVEGGVQGTYIYTPLGEIISTGPSGDRKPGAGVMW